MVLELRIPEGPTWRALVPLVPILLTYLLSFVYLGIAATQPLLAFPYGTVPLFFIMGMGIAAARSPLRRPEPSEST